MDRKLAAILAADVVGYSALMERDEAGTFERLKAGRKELFEPEIARHHGRIFKLMGDGLLAEFGSVVDAVECAVSLQRGLSERNANVPEDQRIQVRIGINLGEVIVEGDDRYGDGVNIAARLEQLADPGGICVSGKVARGGREETRLRLRGDGRAESQEHRRAGPGLPGQARWHSGTGQSAEQAGKLPVCRRDRRPPRSCWSPGPVPGTDCSARRPRSREPSIAVLPFANMSGDPAQDYLGCRHRRRHHHHALVLSHSARRLAHFELRL